MRQIMVCLLQMNMLMLWLICWGLLGLLSQRRIRFGHPNYRPSLGAIVALGSIWIALRLNGFISNFLILLSVWEVLSLLRILAKRRKLEQVLYETQLTWRNLSVAGIVGGAILLLLGSFSLQISALVVAVAFLIFSLSLLLVAFNRIDESSRLLISDYRIESLPTVTLAIPARNETHALTDALRSAVASRYPKLEILVLDDCSQDSTPDIIRTFAHDGVRFIQGSQPFDNWLGKNHAYELLSREASGDLILFCGVDVRLGPDAIDSLVQTMLGKKLKMISVIPKRRQFDALAIFARPLRYVWQLFRPGLPVMSSCWMIDNKALKSMGGFMSVSQQIEPERAFAQALNAKNHYRLLISTHQFDITTRKKASSQFETAVRTLYPISHKDPAWVFVAVVSIGLLEILFLGGLLAPLIIPAVFSYIMLVSSVLLVFAYALVQWFLEPKGWWVAVLVLPITLLLEIWLLIYSLVAYEFGSVQWKGRNICIPIFDANMRERPIASGEKRALAKKQA